MNLSAPTSPKFALRPPPALAALLFVYIGLAVVYTLKTPLFEAPDAYYHFAVIEYMARERDLPPVDDLDERPYRQMAFHAPLYYMVSAALISPIDTGDFVTRYPRNPHAQIGEPAATTNQNFVAHSGDLWRGAGLAARITRAFSICLGVATILSVYAFAALATRSRMIAGLACALVVFNPQFVFISASISNDNLVTALSAVALMLVVWIIRRGLSKPVLITLSFVLALNALAKASGLTMYPVALVAVSVVLRRDGAGVFKVMRSLFMIAAVFTIVAGWWYVNNWVTYGDPTAATQVAEATGLRSGSVDWVGEVRGAFYSFWALFGWFNISVPPVFHYWTGAVTLLALISSLGLAVRFGKKYSRDDALILALCGLFTAGILVGWARFNLLTLAGQGRLWFPLLGIFAAAAAAGLWAIGPRWIPVAVLAPLGIATLVFPFSQIAPAYAAAEQVPIEDASMPEDAVRVDFREPWREDACASLWVDQPVLRGADNLSLGLVYGARCPVTGYWSVFIHIADPVRETCVTGDTGHILSQFDSMPDRGRTPFPALEPGYSIAERISLSVPRESDATADWRVQIGLYDAGGSFIRAFVTPEDGGSVESVDWASVGRCSPELIDLSPRRTPD